MNRHLIKYATTECVRIELDRIGEIAACWRLSRKESDRAFAWRLAIHIQEGICAREREIKDHTQLLDRVLSLSKFPNPHPKD